MVIGAQELGVTETTLNLVVCTSPPMVDGKAKQRATIKRAFRPLIVTISAKYTSIRCHAELPIVHIQYTVRMLPNFHNGRLIKVTAKYCGNIDCSVCLMIVAVDRRLLASIS